MFCKCCGNEILLKKRNFSLKIYIISFLIFLILIISSGCTNKYSVDERKDYAESFLKSKYGKGFTVDLIYGGDYSGVYYGKAHCNDNPELVFTFQTNLNDDDGNTWRDEYVERIKEMDYHKEIDELLSHYGKEFYVKIEVYNDKSLGLEDDYKKFKMDFTYIYVSDEWLDYSNDELWEICNGIATEYFNYYLCVIKKDDLEKIQQEMRSSDELSNALEDELDEKYSFISDYGELRQGKALVCKDEKEEFMEQMEKIRENEELKID